MSSRPQESARVVPSSPDEVRRRIEGSLVSMGHLWFTAPAALRRWDRATSSLYVRALSEDLLEVGPRLANLQAARLCPVVRVRLAAVDEGTRVELSPPRMPAFARGLLGTVGVLCAGWGGVILAAWSTDGPAARGWLFWLGLTAVIPTIVAIARGPGRAALEAGLPDLWRAVDDPEGGADDW